MRIYQGGYKIDVEDSQYELQNKRVYIIEYVRKTQGEYKIDGIVYQSFERRQDNKH